MTQSIQQIVRPCRGALRAVACVGLCLGSLASYAQVPPPMDPISFSGPDPSEQFDAISVEQQLNAQAPIHLEFTDEYGETVTLADYLDGKPAILAMVYYECPMLCTQILNGADMVMKAMKFKLGEDYHAINVSVAHEETPELALEKKTNHLKGPISLKGGEEGWHFLTGNKENIEALAEAVGFRYQYDPASGLYAHSAAIIVLTPDGLVSKYYYGIEYLARNVELGLVDASEGKIGSLADKFTLLCFAYDPSTGTYGFYIIGAMRIGAILTMLGLATFWVTHYLQSRKKQPPNGNPGPATPAV